VDDNRRIARRPEDRMAWSAEQYLKFAAPRLRPAVDLLAQVRLEAPARVCDLGCGTGSATQMMAARWPQAEVIGVDSSPDMLAREAPSGSHVRWLQQDLARFQPPGPCDLIYSNAALHWLPDHAPLFDHLLDQLAPGGVLAVQMPRNFGEPSHTLMHDVARDGPWRARLAGLLGPPPVAEPRWYIARLAPRAASLEVWETVYQQLLSGPDPVKEYTKGTWLMRFLQALPPGEAAAFEAAYAERVRAAYPPLADGRTVFPFRRLFIVATVA
jgi:trans-aconitate 2-methyltransferase